jgi:hypothetical protein
VIGICDFPEPPPRLLPAAAPPLVTESSDQGKQADRETKREIDNTSGGAALGCEYAAHAFS